jgi:transcriptional regulator with PAS, ATPase and Fis domain
VVSPSDLDAKFQSLDILDNPTSTLAELDTKHQDEKRQFITNALGVAGSRRRAAQRLGINESSLRAMIDRLGIRALIEEPQDA